MITGIGRNGNFLLVLAAPLGGLAVEPKSFGEIGVQDRMRYQHERSMLMRKEVTQVLFDLVFQQER